MASKKDLKFLCVGRWPPNEGLFKEEDVFEIG